MSYTYVAVPPKVGETAPLYPQPRYEVPTSYSTIEFISSSTVYRDEPRIFVLNDKEVLRANDPAWFRYPLCIFNYLYRFGFLLMYYLLLLIIMVLSPFIGMASGGLLLLFQAFRGIIRPFGLLFLESIGMGAYYELKTAKLEKELKQV